MLNTSRLNHEVEQIFLRPPKTAVDAAERWATIYTGYTLRADAGPLVRNPALDNVSHRTLRLALLAPFSQNTGRTAAQFTQDIQTALIAYWLTPPQTFIPIPPSVTGAGVTTIVPPTLAAMLLAATAGGMTLKGESGLRTAAKATAFQIDAWTRTITATITILPSPPAPILIT